MQLRVTQIVQTAFLIAVLLISACASNVPRVDATQQNGLLWQILDAGKHAGYIFGTIHSEDERVIKLPEPVNKAFDESSTFALEMELDQSATRAVLQNMYFRDEVVLSKLIAPDLYQRAVIAMSDKGIPENVVNHMKPWAVFSILNMPKQKTGKYLDAVMYQNAVDGKKKVIGLETYQEQIAVFDEMSLEVQVQLLANTLDNLQDMGKMLDETIDIYLSRDLSKIMELSDKYNAILDKEVGEIFIKRLLVDRNHRMFQRMAPLLKNGNAFIAVGALHLPGKEGILNLLKQHDFEINSIY